MEERAKEMFDNAIQEAMKWVVSRGNSIFTFEAEHANNMANYWLGYAAGISELMKPSRKKKKEED